MELWEDDESLSLGSPFKNSYLGSFHLLPSLAKESPARKDTKLPKVHFQSCPLTPDPHSKAVIAALKSLQEKMHRVGLEKVQAEQNARQNSLGTEKYRSSLGLERISTTEQASTTNQAVIAALKSLQEKMRRLELEKVQAEQNMKQISQAAQRYRSSGDPEGNSTTEEASATNQELVCQLQSTEARCALLEKQLDYMRKMVEMAEQDKRSTEEKQASLHREKLKDHADICSKLQKVEKLERECLKFTSSQSEAEKKIELLEQKLHKEEQERKLVQEKTAELQREVEEDLLLCSSAPAGGQQRKKTKAVRKTATVRSVSLGSPCVSRAKQLPFVAGMSTSPSHSVHANIQSVLHMMKHRGPQPWGRSHAHLRPVAKLSPRACGTLSSSQGIPALGSLGDLLLELQEELEEMSLEHQELMKQIEETRKCELREDLERELDCLVQRMEEKGAQISQLRKHQLAVERLKQRAQMPKSRTARINSGTGSKRRSMRPLLSSPESNRSPSKPPSQGNQSSVRGPKGVQRLKTNLDIEAVQWEV
ncbi:centrosomal protein CEP57L1 isoform X2 [Scleropages formosus]|uniref:Centrosomal protein 57kDa-like protein 1 n=1 Tax=Scleropages formosus TaxID=113540 RepID=A0A8C9V4B6_SCLFO|nr:centrosomal protein CEP57L1 isoform X2 [Scleropages formosus]